MIQGPEGLKPSAQNLEDTNVIPPVDSLLISVIGEVEAREKLLRSVDVDKNGVAHCRNSESGIETAVVAVRIDDKKKASIIPLAKENDLLNLGLPPKKPSRIGFFVECRGSDRNIFGVLRSGIYPGAPLTMQNRRIQIRGYATAEEVTAGLWGIEIYQEDEGRWAEDIRLYKELGFDESKAMGIFNKSHRINPDADEWQESPLVVVPEEYDDLVKHFDKRLVKGDEFQVLFYRQKPLFRGIYLGPEEDRIPGVGMKGGLGLGFGNAVSRTRLVQKTSIDSLQGAFYILISPQENRS